MNLKSFVIYATVVLFGVLCFTAGYYSNNKRLSVIETQPTSVLEKRLQENYKFINPLLECDSEIGNSKLLKPLSDQLNSYVKQIEQDKTVSTVGIYYRDLNNGPWFGINENIKFAPASLIKVPVMIRYYKLAESNPKILDSKLKLISTPNVDSLKTFFAGKSDLKMSNEYTINELINSMITKSDNLAYFTLKNNLGKTDFDAIFNDFGIDINAIENSKTDDVLSIREYSSFFRILFNSSYLSRDYSEKALNLLSQTEYKDGLVAGVPNNITVSHKYGEKVDDTSGENQLHDCGIFYTNKNPYILCVMTRGKNPKSLSEVIKEISHITFNYITSE